MSARNEVTEQTRIRRAMLANGYVPLANKEKMTLIRGWAQLQVDEALIDEWDQKLAFRSTGLRIDAPLVAIDVDIDDAELVHKLFTRCAAEWGQDWADSVLIRFGRGAKECWVCRIDEPFRVPPGAKYVRPGDDPKDKEADTYKVELFGGVSGRQIGAYGWHTEGEVTYRWLDDLGPAEVPLERLPVLTKARAFAIYSWYAELLEKAGWHRVLTYDPADFTNVEKLYDIVPGTHVIRHQGGECAVEELRDGDRIRMAEITGTGTNTTRGLARQTHEGIGVWDSETGVTHLLTSAEPKSHDEQHNLLGAKLLSVLGPDRFREEVPEPPVQGERGEVVPSAWDALDGVEIGSWAGMDRLVENLIQRYAHFPSGSKNEEIVDMFTGVGYRKDAFITMMSEYDMELETGDVYAVGARAGQPKTKMFSPVFSMLKHPDRVVLAGYRFEPGNDARLLHDDIGTWLNLYEPPRFGMRAEPDAWTWFTPFMEYLVPDAEDRAWLLNWIAYKVQNPGDRGAGVILVTPMQGTGRNVLMKMLREVMGDRWCRDVPAGVLLGTSGQSQYDDGMINTLLLTCDEIAMDGASYDKRLLAYERLKATVDPYRQKRSLNRKGLSMIEATVCYSTLMASNHPYDALPLSKQDRRFAVIHCTLTPFAKTPGLEHIRGIVDRVLPHGRPSNHAAMAGLREWLLSLETDVERFMLPPLNETKRTMIEDQKGEVEETIDAFLAKLPPEQTCFWFDDLVRRGEDWLDKRPSVRQHFKRNARKLLREGYAGWTYPDKAFRVTETGGASPLCRGIVQKSDAQELTPGERGRWLGERRA